MSEVPRERSSITAISVSGRLPWYCRPCIGEIYVARNKHEMLLIGLSDERGVTRYAAIVVCHSSLTTAAKSATCTPIAAPCRTKRKRSQDSRRIDAKPRA